MDKSDILEIADPSIGIMEPALFIPPEPTSSPNPRARMMAIGFLAALVLALTCCLGIPRAQNNDTHPTPVPPSPPPVIKTIPFLAKEIAETTDDTVSSFKEEGAENTEEEREIERVEAEIAKTNIYLESRGRAPLSEEEKCTFRAQARNKDPRDCVK